MTRKLEVVQSVPIEQVKYAYASAVSAGDAIFVTGLGALVAHDDYESGETGVYYKAGRFRGNLASAVTIAQGDKLAYDISAGTIRDLANASLAAGDFFLGTAAEAGTATAGYVVFDLNYDARPTLRQLIAVENLAAAADISARPIFIAPDTGCQLVSAGILTQGTPVGVDDSNTSIIALKDASGNTIVTKTYNTATQPPTSAYGSLGSLDATYKVLLPGEVVTLDVTNGGTTSDLPAFMVVLTYQMI